MNKAAWAAKLPALRKAIDKAKERRATVKAKVWHDNEKFLLQPRAYKKHGLQMMKFPTNSGDLNPIENVWARLRLDLAKLERKEFSMKPRHYLTPPEFKSRGSSLLRSFGVVQRGQQYSYLQKLVRGMPRRLAKCRRNLFGRCGK